MNTGSPWEIVYVDLVFADETFGMSQPLTRYEADYNLRRLSIWPYLDGDSRRVVKTEIVYIDPQPEIVFPQQQGIVLQ